MDIVKILLKKRVRIVCFNKNGENPISIACCKRYIDILAAIIEHMNELDKVDSKRISEEDEEKLLNACKKGDLNLISIFDLISSK